MSKLICKVCGSAYSFCPGCVKDMDKPRWMVSFDKPECKTVFDTLVANSAGKISDAEALEIVEKSGVVVRGASVLSHVEKLRNGGQPKREAAPVMQEVEMVSLEPEKKEEEKEKDVVEKVEEPSLFKKTSEEEKEKENKSLGSLFGKNNAFSSNSKNKEKVKEDAVAIGNVIGQIDEKHGF